MTPYTVVRDRIAPAVDRNVALLARLEVLQRGLSGAAADEAVCRLLNATPIAEARERQIEALVLQVLTEAGIRPVMQ